MLYKWEQQKEHVLAEGELLICIFVLLHCGFYVIFWLGPLRDILAWVARRWKDTFLSYLTSRVNKTIQLIDLKFSEIS